MNFVQPIRDRDKISEIKDYLIVKNQRDYMLFFLGVNVGLRIGDLLSLKVKDVQGHYINIKEQKTDKTKRILIPNEVKKALIRYTTDMHADSYLFPSRNGKRDRTNRAISDTTAYRMMKDIESKFKLENLGTHSLRKTFGYHFYNQFKDVAALQEIFNHSDPAITLRYIGINQDKQDTLMKKKFVL